MVLRTPILHIAWEIDLYETGLLDSVTNGPHISACGAAAPTVPHLLGKALLLQKLYQSNLVNDFMVRIDWCVAIPAPLSGWI